MKIVEPKVHLVSKPELNWDQLELYLTEVGGQEWLWQREGEAIDRKTTDAEILAEAAGRLCYRSWAPQLNKNVTRVREDQSDYLENILSSAHGSVLEHANFTFLFKDVSRVFTHELVRHRAGSAFSQESMRFVRLDELAMWMPDWAKEDEILMAAIEHHVLRSENLQIWMAEHFKLDDPGTSFEEKKSKTSFMRRFAPEGVATSIMWTANSRTLRNVIEQRTAKGAEEEIRLVFDKVGSILQQEAPMLFGDYEVEDGVWVPKYRKV